MDDSAEKLHTRTDRSGLPILETATEHRERKREARESEQHDFNRRQVKLATGNLLTQALLVVFGLGGLTASWFGAVQARRGADAAIQAANTARDTLNEVRFGSGASDTHTLALQAKTQAEQTTALANATKEQATALAGGPPVTSFDPATKAGVPHPCAASSRTGGIPRTPNPLLPPVTSSRVGHTHPGNKTKVA